MHLLLRKIVRPKRGKGRRGSKAFHWRYLDMCSLDRCCQLFVEKKWDKMWRLQTQRRRGSQRQIALKWCAILYSFASIDTGSKTHSLIILCQFCKKKITSGTLNTWKHGVSTGTHTYLETKAHNNTRDRYQPSNYVLSQVVLYSFDLEAEKDKWGVIMAVIYG